MNLITPFPEEHLPVMWEWLQEFRKQMVDDFCPTTFEEMVTVNQRGLDRGMKMYAAMQEGKVVGAVWGDPIGDDQYLGHLVFDRSLDRAAKFACARAAVFTMFATGARKISWASFADNRAFIIFLRKIGAVIEGRLRDGARRNGELVDVVVLASFPEKRGECLQN